MSIAIALACALLLTYGNGANDTLKGVATLLRSGTTDYRKAPHLATAATFAGLCGDPNHCPLNAAHRWAVTQIAPIQPANVGAVAQCSALR